MKNLRESSVKGLRFLERYTKTDMVYLAKGGFWLGLGQVVSTGSAFLMSVAFANLLSPETYGIYKFVLSINSLILITTLTGMDSAVTQAVSRGYEGTIDPGFKAKMKWGVIGSIISFIIAVYYYTQGNVILAISFCVVSLFVPFTESTDIYNSLLWGKKLFNIQAKYNVINVLIILIVTTATLFFTHNLCWILIAYLLSLTIPNIFFLWKSKKTYQTNDNIDPEAIKYGKHLSGINIINLILTQLDKVLVFHYLGATNLAIYSLAIAPTDQLKGLLKNLNALAMPKFSKRTSQEIKSNIWNKTSALAFGTTLIVLLYIFFAPLLYRIFFPKYLSSIPYSQVMAVSVIFGVLAGLTYTILESQKATKELYKFNVFNNSISLISLFPLIYFYGMWGAVLSRLLTRIITYIYSIYLIKKLN